MDISIRKASVEDAPSIQKLAKDIWPAAYGSILSKEQLEYMLDKYYSTDILTKQMNDHHFFYLAFCNQSPVGFASFSMVETNKCKLHKLYVLPSIQKTGLGKQLLEKTEWMAKEMGANTLQLNVNRNNSARLFYERNDFSIIREEDIDIGNGFFMNDYVMEKELR